MKESDLKSWIRKTWDGWCESFEPRIGTGVGIPDMMFIIQDVLVPVELKVGVLSDDGLVLYPSEVRAAQLQWHHACNNAGVASWFLVGTGTGKKPDRVFLVAPHHMVEWRDGINIVCLIEFCTKKKEFCFDVRKWM